MSDMKGGGKEKPVRKVGKLWVLLLLALKRPLKKKVIQMIVSLTWINIVEY
jgi:hypothetical protein